MKLIQKICKIYIFLLLALLLLTACNMPDNNSAIETTETMEDFSPFEVQIDKSALENRKEKEATVIIFTEIADWSYTAYAKNGKVSNLSDSSFTYTVPQDERIKEDTITVLLSDNENGKEYEWSIPLIFFTLIDKE